MKPAETPKFSFQREGKTLTVWFSPHPLKSNEGKTQSFAFRRECNSELEAALLLDYVQEFHWLIQKEYFTAGYDTKKRKEPNYML